MAGSWQKLQLSFCKYFRPGVVVFIFTFLVYFISGKHIHTQHHFFVPLAQAFLNGHLYVDKMTYYLHEMVTPEEISTGVFKDYIDGATGKYYVIFPPLPAILLMPFVALWGENTNQSLFSILIASLSTVIAFQVFRSLKLNTSKSLWLSALFAFGSMQWYHAVIGSAWYLSLICAMLFLWLAIWATIKKKNFLLIGFLLGCAYLSRFATILAFPFFLLMNNSAGLLEKKKILIRSLLFFTGLAIPVIFSLVYNWARYSTIWHLGYTVYERRYYNWEYQLGTYSLSYFPRHLKAIFLSFPIKINHFPYLLPNTWSMALWLVMPAIILIFWAPVKQKIVWVIYLTLLFLLPTTIFLGGVGASQFGYRYALDYMPFLFLLIAQAIKNNFYWWQKGLIILSIAVNFWGIYTSFWLS